MSVKVLFEKRTIPRLLALIWAVLIGLLSTRVRAGAPILWGSWIEPDKVAHFMSYALLCYLALWSFSRPGARWSWTKSSGIALCCALYGLIWEVVQYEFFPHRHFEWADMLANMIGTFAGLLFFRYFYPANQSGGE